MSNFILLFLNSQAYGNYTLTLSNDKNMVLSVFKENVYCHIWDNRNKRHVSLNIDELAGMLKNNSCSGHHAAVTHGKCEEKILLSICGAENWNICTCSF